VVEEVESKGPHLRAKHLPDVGMDVLQHLVDGLIFCVCEIRLWCQGRQCIASVQVERVELHKFIWWSAFRLAHCSTEGGGCQQEKSSN